MAGKGLPFGRPAVQPPQNQFIDERRRSLETRVPVNGVIFASLTSAQLALWFSNGVGLQQYPFAGWALCDGQNGRPTLADHGTAKALIRVA